MTIPKKVSPEVCDPEAQMTTLEGTIFSAPSPAKQAPADPRKPWRKPPMAPASPIDAAIVPDTATAESKPDTLPKTNGAAHDMPAQVPDAPLVQSAADKLHPLPKTLEPLISIPHWVCWRYKKKEDGTYTKPPFQTNGALAENNNSETWSTFEAAAQAVKRFNGVGFVLTNTDITAFDLDHCRDAETGIIEPWAAALVDKAGSYTEISPSGTGLRIIGYGSGGEVHRKLPVPKANGMNYTAKPHATSPSPAMLTAMRRWPILMIPSIQFLPS
jgi:hypothetical protein